MTPAIDTTAVVVRERKRKWQRENRRQFKESHGYSSTANYGVGKLREAVLDRDGRKCVSCGMTEAEHLIKWLRPITVDHRDRDRSHNTMDNLQTLCLSCHGAKDQLPSLRVPKVPDFREHIMSMRAAGNSYQTIADKLGFSIAAIWKWCKRWEVEA